MFMLIRFKKNALKKNHIFYAIEPAGRGRKWWWDSAWLFIAINNLFIHSQFALLMLQPLIYHKTEGYFGFVLIKVIRRLCRSHWKHFHCFTRGSSELKTIVNVLE